MLMALLVVAFSMNVTSCKDDDNDEQRRADAEVLDTQEAQTAWRWLCALTNEQTLSDNWAQKTYEPTIGVASEQNALTRLVIVSSLDEAMTDFASMADVEVSRLTSTVTVQTAGVGRLTWTPSPQGAQNLAEVEVDTKLIPQLQKIVYCTSEQTGQNGLIWDSMKGVAYYRLGDVVCDEKGYYWVCVRPSFAPDKGDSHWINVFNAAESGDYKSIPSEYVCGKYNYLEKYGFQTIKLPLKIPYSRKHIHNFTNLIWALLQPGNYHSLVGEGNGLCGFKYTYHGEKFLNDVNKFWNEKIEGFDIWQKIFNTSYGDMQNLHSMRFFYKDYSWWWGNEATMWSYIADNYEQTMQGSESGDKDSYNVVDNGFDVNFLAHDPLSQGKYMQSQFGGTWILRYKSGAQLCKDGKYDPYDKLTGCTDIYCYNKKKNVKVGKNEEQETENKFKTVAEPLKAPQVGCVIGSDGRFYESPTVAEDLGLKAVAMVVYYGDEGSVEIGISHRNYRGMAIAMQDLNNQRYQIDWKDDMVCKTGSRSATEPLATAMDGHQGTYVMTTGCMENHTHPAATECFKYAAFDKGIREEYGFSEWFIPSAGQMIMALQTMGLTYDDGRHAFSGDHQTSVANDKLTSWGMKANGLFKTGTRYMTTTQVLGQDKAGNRVYSEYYSFRFNSSYDGIEILSTWKNMDDVAVRPFILF